MKLEMLIHRVEARLFAVGRSLFGADGRADVRDEAEELRAEQARWRSELDQANARREQTRRRIAEHETAASLLPSQIEHSVRRGKHSQAVRLALELDRIRRELIDDRAALPGLEQACWSLAFHLRSLGRRLDRLNQPAGRRR